MRKIMILVMGVVVFSLVGCKTHIVEPTYSEGVIQVVEPRIVKGTLLGDYEETLEAFKGAEPGKLKEQLTEKMIEHFVPGKSEATEKTPKDGIYKVLDCYDGDTCTILVGTKKESVRLLNVDAPEIKSKDPFAAEARKFMRKELVKAKVHVEFGLGKERTGRDAYGRLLAYITKNDQSINEMLVSKGLARVAYVFEPDMKYVKTYRAAESEAKRLKLGIWSIDKYVTDKGYARSHQKAG